MATRKIGKIFVGSGDLSGGTYSTLSSGTTTPANSYGVDGDIFIKIAGYNSDIFLKRNGVWEPLARKYIQIVVPDNTTDFVFLTLTANEAHFVQMQMGVRRGSNFRKSEISVLNNGTSAVLSEYGVVTLGSPVGVNFSVAITGPNLTIRASTDSQGVDATLYLILTDWY